MKMLRTFQRITVKYYQSLRSYYYLQNGHKHFSNIIFKSEENISKSLFGHRSSRISFNSGCKKAYFHTTLKRDALPPVLLMLLRPLTKIVAMVFGRSIRIWWKKLPESRKQALLLSMKQRKYFLLAFLSPIPVGAVYFYTTHVDENPITKRRRFIAFSPQQLLKIAEIEEQILFEMHQNSILPPGDPSYGRVCRIVRKLLHSNQDIEGILTLNWRVVVVDLPDIINAFVLPNGTLFMFTGMLRTCSNEDHLGIVIAHEISHAILQHSAEQVSNAQLIECLLFIPVVVIWALLPDLGAILMQYVSSVLTKTLLHLPFSRQIEIEADNVGLTLAAKACIDVREAPCFWKKMKAATIQTSKEETEWLSTHPSYDTRQTLLDELIPNAISIRESCQCPKLSSRDPRHFIDSLLENTKDGNKVPKVHASASQVL